VYARSSRTGTVVFTGRCSVRLHVEEEDGEEEDDEGNVDAFVAAAGAAETTAREWPSYAEGASEITAKLPVAAFQCMPLTTPRDMSTHF
jgi:hypothetical protein